MTCSAREVVTNALDLTGKVAVISGGARGQGASHALTLGRAGASVVLIDIVEQIATVPYPMATPADVSATQERLTTEGVPFAFRQGDLRDPQVAQAAIDEAIDRFGRVDIVVPTAGICIPGSVLEATDADWQDTLDVNVTGVFNLARAGARRLVEQNEGGSIIFTGSFAATRGSQGLAAYTAAKHAIVGLMRCFAADLGEHSIRANLINPGTIDTPMIANDAIYGRFRPDLPSVSREQAADAFQALNRLPIPWLEAKDISAAVLWFASDESRFVTGSELAVDAGMAL
ncbi:MAG: oxidoreductase, family [Pseudonocardiales bacterium]|nr:oxidoreductase, family [Pseudonocardiales bacterium]